jgi:hypothetical protein
MTADSGQFYFPNSRDKGKKRGRGEKEGGKREG